MNTIYWHMNVTKGGANLHPSVNLLPGANLHPGANCANKHGFRYLNTVDIIIKSRKYCQIEDNHV